MNRDLSSSSFSQLLTEKITTVAKSTDLEPNKPVMVQSIFNNTSCYDLMQASSKVSLSIYFFYIY